MTHTENEAEKLWCPPLGGRCIAKGCMMWRWAQKPNPEWKPPNMMTTYGIDTRNDPPMYIDDTTRGYCGLGGRS